MTLLIEIDVTVGGIPVFIEAIGEVEFFFPIVTIGDVINLIEENLANRGRLMSDDYYFSKYDMNLQIGEFKNVQYIGGKKIYPLNPCKRY